MPDLTLELILGWVFSPLAFLLGVPWNEAVIAGSFIGQKLVVNEFVAYLNFAPYLVEGAAVVLSPKTTAIVSLHCAASPTSVPLPFCSAGWAAWRLHAGRTLPAWVFWR